MSKQIKQLEMDALKKTFQGVRDFVLLSPTKVSCALDGQIRANLRKKKVRVQMIKNSLTRRVFSELGINISQDSPYWQGTTWLCWGLDSVAELSKELETIVIKNPAMKDRLKVKGAIAEGEAVPFDQALRMPTRTQAIGMVLSMVLGPASQIAGQIAGPASQLAGQVKTLSDKKPEEEPAPAPASTPA